MSRTKPLTMEQHVALSKELWAMREDALKFILVLGPTTPENNCNMKKLWRIINTIDDARELLERRMFWEHGCNGLQDVYAWWRNERRSA